jgi:uncharacterized protein (TIGR00290 family)
LYELARDPRFEVVALVTTVTEGYDRVSMHGVRCSLLRQQANALGLPLVEVTIPPAATNEVYERRMGETLGGFSAQGVRRVTFGDIFLEDLRAYRERQLGSLGMECLFPIWKRDSAELVRTFINLGFRAITTCVNPRLLDPSFIGRVIDRNFVDELPPNVDPCGENGEFHSFVFDGPTFRSPIPFTRGEVVLRDSFFFCDLLSENPADAAQLLTDRPANAR